MPSATARTAAAISRGGVSLSRKPAAPAASAAYTYSSTWNVVRTATCGGCGWARICRVAARPSSTGIRMSISTTSGRSSRAARTPAAPSPASPTTSKPPAASSTVRRPNRTSSSSSTSSTRITSAAPPRRRSRRPAAARPAAGRPACAPAHPGRPARSRRRRPARSVAAPAPLTTRTTQLVRVPLDVDRAPGRPGRACRRWSAPPGRSGRPPSPTAPSTASPPAGPCRSTAIPAARASSTSRSRSLEAGLRGQRRARSSTSLPRSTPTIWRSSSSACRPADCTCAGELLDPVPVGRGHLDRAGLQHHEAHPVADGVVHLAGDPGALAQHRLAGHQLPFGLGAFGSPAQRGEQVARGSPPGPRRRRAAARAGPR